jgi:hypothetical protein
MHQHNSDAGRLESRIFLAAIAATACLIAYGLARIPVVSESRTALRSIAAATFILAAYGVVGWHLIRRAHAHDHFAARVSEVLGIACIVIFATEMILEYVLLPKNNTQYGLIEFGLVFALYFIAAAATSFRGRTWRRGVGTSALTAMIASLGWWIAVLLIFYAFRGTDRQAQVFAAEGNNEDFLRSGMTNFTAFVMEDFLGAGFFHLLLGPVFALFLGSFGALLGMLLCRLGAPGSRRPRHHQPESGV